MADVADQAEVSKSTVSAVINDKDVVKDTTRQRVLQAVRSLNYRPSGSARRRFQMPNRKSIGFVIKEADNPYYAEILGGIKEVTAEKQYLTFVSSSEGHAATEKEIVEQFSSKDLDGLIITPILNNEADLSHIFALQRSNIPFVLLEDVRGLQANLVDVDNTEASCNAVKHLFDLGHEHFVHFAGPEYSEHSEERAEGVRRAFSESQLVFDDAAVIRTGDSFEDGYRQATELFSSRDPLPTAVTCYNDLVALGVMKALTELGIDVPEEVSVVGFDDLAILDYFPMPLTTVHVPKVEMGRRAAEMLIHTIESDTKPPIEKIPLQASLVERASTAPPSR